MAAPDVQIERAELVRSEIEQSRIALRLRLAQLGVMLKRTTRTAARTAAILAGAAVVVGAAALFGLGRFLLRAVRRARWS